MGLQRLAFSQKLPITLEQCWDFFSSPRNLSLITPSYLGFRIHDGYAETNAYSGQIISYTLYPVLGFPVNWVTEITHVEKPNFFIDVQLRGPYRIWHHEHRFSAVPGGVEVLDTVDYLLPFGPIGSLINLVKVKRQVTAIFEFRRKRLEEIFGSLQ